MSLKLIGRAPHSEGELSSGQFRGTAFTEKIGSEKQNLPVLVDHDALKLC